MSEGVFSWAERLKQIPGQASALGKQGMDAIRSAAVKVGSALPASATEAGRMAGNAVNSATEAMGGLKTAASDAAGGFRTATSGVTPQPSPAAGGFETPPSDTARFGQNTAGFQKDAVTAGERLGGAGSGGIPPEGKPGLLRRAAGAGGKALGFAGKIATPAVAGYGVLSEAGDQMDRGEVGAANAQESVNGSGMFASQNLVDSRMGRMKGLMDAGLSAINPLNLLPDSLNPMASASPLDRRGKDFGRPAGGRPSLAQQPVQPGTMGPGMVPTNQGAMTPEQVLGGDALPDSGFGAFRRESGARKIDPVTGKDLGPIGAQGRGQAVKVGGNAASFGGLLPALAKDATPEQAREYLQKSQDLQAIENNGREALRKDLARIQTGGRSPFDVGKGPAGAIAGLSAYGAMSRMQKNDAELGVRQDANNVARQKAAFDMADKNRADLRKQQEVNRGTMDKELEDYARGKVGDPKINETAGDHASRVKGELSKVRTDINYSLGNRKDGRKLEDLEPAERQQLLLAKSIKDRVVDARGDLGQKFRDYFGNKQFDSKDLYSYMPKRVEPTTAGGYKVLMANGNTMTVQAARGGGFNLTGPNDPVDADIQQLISPLVDKYEKSQKGK